MSLIAVVVIAAFAIYIMTPQERLRLLPRVVRRSPKAFGDPARFGLVVPAVTGINVILFALMAMAGAALGGPETLVAWGANFGPRTTNGEWGRLLTSMFVHAGPLHLLATMIGLVQAGLIVERLAGRVTFSAVYATAGFLASAVSLWRHPVDVSAGASGGVFGLYGFLAATALWGLASPTGVRIPLQILKTFLPATALFALYSIPSGALPLDAELSGCAAGFLLGLLLTREAGERTPATPRVLAAVGSAFVLAAAIAIPLYGLADVRPEIERMVRIENGTAAQYQSAVGRFRNGLITGKELARLINRNILPELEAARRHLSAIGRIPREHQPLAARAAEFLMLREQSWRVRAEALETHNMATLRRADALELTSRQTLESLTLAR